MARLLNVRRNDGESMDSLRNRLESELESIGVDYVGRIGNFEATSRFPSAYVFESPGEGGFVLEYDKGMRVSLVEEDSPSAVADVVLVPVGATGSLVQRVYSHLKQKTDCFERIVE